jgi:hypothetical protein
MVNITLKIHKLQLVTFFFMNFCSQQLCQCLSGPLYLNSWYHFLQRLKKLLGELAVIENFMKPLIENKIQGSMYISGRQGTGKTACVTHIPSNQTKV